MARSRIWSVGVFVSGCLLTAGLFVSGCSQGGDSLAIAAGQGNPLESVTVVNTLSNPIPTIDTENPAKQPFVASATSTGATQVKVTTVPAGKRLVIEAISTFSRITLPGTGIRPVLRFFTNGTPSGFFIAQTSVGQTATESIWTSTHAVRLYIDPSTDLTLTCEATLQAGPMECIFLLSGHLVNLS